MAWWRGLFAAKPSADPTVDDVNRFRAQYLELGEDGLKIASREATSLPEVIAAVGIYGVMAYSVSQRTQEIGIRMALGAQRGDVLRMIVGQAMALTAAGIVSGAFGAVLLTRVMTGLLFNVKPGDPLTFSAVAVVLALVAASASYIPGRRATRVDPVIALRAE